MSLIERAAPHPDAAERHEIEVRAPSDVVYRTLWSADLGGSWVVRGLLALRSLPAAIGGRRRSKAPAAATLRSAVAAGFGIVAEEPEREVVLGVTGRFWRAVGNVEPFDRESFARPIPPGMARGLWSFRVVPAGEGRAILSTETRVICGDAASRRKFLLYWFVIRPFSGLIRIRMLEAIRDAAHTAAAGSACRAANEAGAPSLERKATGRRTSNRTGAASERGREA